jgi:ATP-dependent metalloprotease
MSPPLPVIVPYVLRRYHVTKQQLLAMMDTMMGGRAAEELIFGPDKITSGKLFSISHSVRVSGGF